MKNVNICELEAVLRQIHSDSSFMQSLPRSGNKYFKEVRRETVEEFLHLSQKEKAKRTSGKCKEKGQVFGQESCWGFGEHKLFCLLAEWVRQCATVGL